MLEMIELVLLFIGVLVGLLWISEKSPLPAPFLLVPAGILISFIPSFPPIHFNHQLALFVFLPPLLYSGGFLSSWSDFRMNLRPILLLSVGLVVATTFGVAWVAYRFIPGLGWAEALVLGALVSPPDVVAILAIANKLGLPKRVVTILEGEGLFNDATALTLCRLAVAFVAAGGAGVSISEVTLQFCLIIVGEVVYGLLIAWFLGQMRQFLKDPHLDLMVSLLTPFLAFLPPEHLGGSGFLAVVVAGIYGGRQSERVGSYEVRLKALPVWNFLISLLHDVLFLLTGLQFRSVVQRLSFLPPWELIKRAALISITVIVIRILWVFPASYLPRWLTIGSRRRDPTIPWSWVFVMSWSGMRGAVSLAAALAVPELIDERTPFLSRDLIIFLTFSVILSTLLLQGLSLIPLIRSFGLQKVYKDEVARSKETKIRARKLVIKAVLGKLRKWKTQESFPDNIISEAEQRYQRFLEDLTEEAGRQETRVASVQKAMNSELIAFKRKILLELRSDEIITDQQLRQIQEELDVQELRLEFEGLG
jgi:monovalent cation/hydrogen antiporter